MATIAEVAAAGVRTPLMYLLQVMNDATAAVERRDRAAAILMPYLHSRLNAVAWLPKSNFDLDDDDGHEAENFVKRLMNGEASP